MKLTILFLLFALTNTFAQTKDNSFSIKIVATTNNVNAFIFNIVERTDSIKIRYSILDSIRLESLRKDPEYINIHNIGSTFTVNTDTIIQEKIYKALAVITDKYRVYNVDSIRFSLTEYPNYKKLLDSAYNGINFSDKKDRVVFDGVKYSVTISSAKINRTYIAIHQMTIRIQLCTIS
jgi:hypothetical protein